MKVLSFLLIFVVFVCVLMLMFIFICLIVDSVLILVSCWRNCLLVCWVNFMLIFGWKGGGLSCCFSLFSIVKSSGILIWFSGFIVNLVILVCVCG